MRHPSPRGEGRLSRSSQFFQTLWLEKTLDPDFQTSGQGCVSEAMHSYTSHMDGESHAPHFMCSEPAEVAALGTAKVHHVPFEAATTPYLSWLGDLPRAVMKC